mgnify:FL=1
MLQIRIFRLAGNSLWIEKTTLDDPMLYLDKEGEG